MLRRLTSQEDEKVLSTLREFRLESVQELTSTL